MYSFQQLLPRCAAVLFAAALLLSPLTPGAFIAHAGTQTDISTCAALAAVNDDLAASYELTDDLDCSEEGDAIVIGSSANPFTGTFDGQEHTLTLNIATTSNNVGLFSKLDGASVHSLEIDGSVSGGGNVGALAGTAADGATISQVAVTADVTGTGQMVGGIIGYLRDSTSLIENSYSTGSVIGTRTGGIAGYMEASSQVQKSYATGHITSIGGIVGGIAGQTDDSGGEPVISDSFSTAVVDGQGDSRIGGIIGITSSSAALDMQNDYFDIDQAGTTTCAVGDFGNTFYQGAAGTCVGANSDGTDASHFKSASADPLSSWDFDNVWGIVGPSTNDGFPVLLWQEVAAAPSPVVLAEVTPISSPTNADDAQYAFSISNPDDFDGEYEVTECGPGSCTVRIDPDTHVVSFADLESGDYDPVSFDFVYNDGTGTTTSNTLTIGAFTVIAEASHHTSHGSSGQSVPAFTAASTQSLADQIAALTAQYEALLAQLGTAASGTTPARDLDVGMSGTDVKSLQALLIAQGYAIPAGATGFFANQTRDALAKYQAEHGIVPPVGYFGSITRTEMKSRSLAGLWW